MKTEAWNPGKLLGLSGNYWMACALHAGVKLELFTVIGDQSLSNQEIAQKLDGDPRGVAMLLNALSAMELLTKKEALYSNTPFSRSFLVRKAPQYLGYMIMHHHHLMESWTHLDLGVKTGKPLRGKASFSQEAWRENFLMGMFNMAMMLAPRIVPKIDLSTRRSFLDMSGGPGTYAIQFCLNNPGMQAVVFDLPTTRPFAETTIGKYGLSDRIRFQAGSYLKDPVEGRYDVAWLSHILHGEGPDDCQGIIQKAVSALSPGGMILIHEFILNNEMSGPLFPALFSLNMLLGTASGQAYSEQQLSNMLTGAGVRNIHRIAIDSPNDSGIIAGVV